MRFIRIKANADQFPIRPNHAVWKTHAQLFEILRSTDLYCWYAEYEYSSNLVENGRVTVPEDNQTLFFQDCGPRPIAINISKTLEVWTRFKRWPPIDISYPTTLLYPGELFGLFEQFAPELDGKWNISSGVRDILVMEDFGDDRRLKKTAASTGTQKDLQWNKKSHLRFYRLVGDPPLSEWSSGVLFLPSLDKFRDELDALKFRGYLLRQTVHQLSRLVKSFDDQRYRRGVTSAEVLERFRNLIESTLHGARTAYYQASREHASSIEEDVPYHRLMSNVGKYIAWPEINGQHRTSSKQQQHKSVETDDIPVFIPALTTPNICDRFSNRLYHFLDLEPSVCTEFAGSGIGRLADQVFPMKQKSKEIPWANMIRKDQSIFRGKNLSDEYGQNLAQIKDLDIRQQISNEMQALDAFTEFVFRDSSDKERAIVRLFCNYNARKNVETMLRNHCRIQWLSEILFRNSNSLSLIGTGMIINTLMIELIKS